MTQPKDGDLVELFLTKDAATRQQNRYRGSGEYVIPTHVRGRVYGKSRGLDFAVELFVPQGEVENVRIDGANALINDEWSGGRVHFLELSNLTLEERLHYAFAKARQGYGRLRLFEDRRDRYSSDRVEKGFAFGTDELSLTLNLDTCYADEPQLRVCITQDEVPDESEDAGRYDTVPGDTFSVSTEKRDYSGRWTTPYRGFALTSNALQPGDAVSYAVNVLNTLHELTSDLESNAAWRGKEEEEKAITEMLTPFNLAFFKRYGHTTPV